MLDNTKHGAYDVQHITGGDSYSTAPLVFQTWDRSFDRAEARELSGEE